jgi:hypothetical protein
MVGENHADLERAFFFVKDVLAHGQDGVYPMEKKAGK